MSLCCILFILMLPFQKPKVIFSVGHFLKVLYSVSLPEQGKPPPPPCPSAVVFQGDVIYIPSWNPGSSQWVHSAVKKKIISAANVPGEVGQYERDEWREEDSKYLLYCSLPLLHDAARMEVKETKRRLSFLFHFPSSCHSCETISPASSLSLPLSLPFFERGWLNTEVIAVTN